LDGKLLKGKSRSARYVFLIPPKHQNDVVLEFSPDFEHDSAMFSGSINRSPKSPCDDPVWSDN
jgi:hypothetical protein